MISVGFSMLLMGVSFVVTMLLYPYILRLARKHGFVDNPCARKLQRVPVPVMGGMAVFAGLLTTILIFCAFVPDSSLWKVLLLLFVMWLVGSCDDRMELSPAFRFLVESVVMWLVLRWLDLSIDDLHGFWGIRELSEGWSIPLSMVAGVGIMNAVNLIDGVDGYCSGYTIFACTCFAVLFFYAGDRAMFSLALLAIGAVIPFFFHNVFGKTSKMFLGDGGSLTLGTLLAIFVLRLLSKDSACVRYDEIGLSLPALSLAILAVPVFDTLRVMVFRVIRGRSPFSADKTHLHHLFIDLNFSHLSTSGLIVTGNMLIVAVVLAGWLLGLSVNGQMYLVVVLALLFTVVFYFLMDSEHRKNDGEGSRLWQRLSQRGKATNLSTKPAWQLIRRIVDSRWLGTGLVKDPPADDSGPDEAEQA